MAVPVASVSGPAASAAPPTEPEPVEPKREPHTIAWLADEAAGRKEAEHRHVGTVVWFDAAWCTTCRELERDTFASRAVRLAMKGFVAIRVDATDDEDPKTVALVKRYAVVGMPTIVIVDPSGHESGRITHFVKPAAFVAQLKAATPR